MNWYLVFPLLFSVICFFILFDFYRRKNGVFQAPFIFTLSSMLMMLPQMSFIAIDSYYDSYLLWDLSFCMITGTIAFAKGFDRAQFKHFICCYDVSLKKSKWLFVVMFVIGIICAYYSYIEIESHYQNIATDFRKNSRFQVLNFFVIYLDVSFYFALNYLLRRYKNSRIAYVILILGTVYYLYRIIFNARRAVTVQLILNTGLFLTLLKPKYESIIKKLIVLFFIVGTIGQASIGIVRGNLHRNDDEKIEINYIDNYLSSYYDVDLIHGMDLGNGALLIKYCKDNMNYNYGLFLWNDIVTWYFPKFIFGEQGKKSLMVFDYNNDYIEKITHGVTTQTGYFQAFSAFGYFGFVVFYFTGYLIGFIWNRAKVSTLYMIIYMCFVYNLPNLSSHGFSYIFGQIEIFLLFCMPLLIKYIHLKYINVSLGKHEGIISSSR
ncbi:MAG: oligosaccharide repeat unit polymerase [Bacteroidales bacterium]|nr:oligosaccharide repeat unit polymerase [Bacteroidales bacterium]